MTTTRVITHDGDEMLLHTSDTHTLAFFDGMVESTPATLLQHVSRFSLRQIADHSPDSNERSKAERALSITVAA